MKYVVDPIAVARKRLWLELLDIKTASVQSKVAKHAVRDKLDKVGCIAAELITYWEFVSKDNFGRSTKRQNLEHFPKKEKQEVQEAKERGTAYISATSGSLSPIRKE